MRTNNLFDHMDNDIDNIETESITEDTGINEDRVKEIVMKNIDSKSTVKTTRKSSKRVRAVLIAAAAVLAVGTFTAYATGGINNLMGNLIAGEPVNGMYGSGSATVKSDDVIIDYKGVAGDKRDAYAVCSITKKDGSAFVTSDKELIGVVSEKADKGEQADVTCTLPLFSKLTEGLFYDGHYRGGDVYYELSDDNTVTAYVSYHDRNSNLIGQTVTVKDDSLVFYYEEEVLCESETYKKLIADDTGKGDKEIEKIYNDAEKTLTDNQVIIVSPDFDLVIASKENVNISYEVSFPLNYREISKDFDVNGKKVKYSDTDMTMMSLNALPLSIRLEMQYNTNDRDELISIHKNQDPDSKNSVEITLKDGKKYVFDEAPLNTSDNKEILEYKYYEGGSLGTKPMCIDPEQIARISFNGTILYDITA